MDSGLSTVDYHYYHTDHLGSSNVITDETGSQVARYEYSPYGSLAVQEPLTENRAPNYLFTGKELDSSGLYFYGARYYDPEIGRFVSADTIVQAPYDPQSLNRYAYCRNNPLKYTDPSGHSFLSWLGKILGVVAAAVGFVVSGGNPAVAFACFNITDTVVSGAQAMAAGANPGIVFGTIGMSIGLNLLVPTPSTGGDLLWQIGANAVRGAGIASATTASFGGNVAEAAAWGGGMGAVGGLMNSEQLNNTSLGQGFRSNADVLKETRNLEKLSAMLTTDGMPSPTQSIDGHTNIGTYWRGLAGNGDKPSGYRFHPAMRDFSNNSFTELTVNNGAIGILRGGLADMTAATQNYVSSAVPDSITTVYGSAYRAAIRNYENTHVGRAYFMGSVFRDCRGYQGIVKASSVAN